jgi:hypothetical protein
MTKKSELHLHFSSYCKQLTIHLTLFHNLVKKASSKCSLPFIKTFLMISYFLKTSLHYTLHNNGSSTHSCTLLRFSPNFRDKYDVHVSSITL